MPKLVLIMARFLAGILILSVLGFEIGGVWAMLSTIMGLVAIGFVVMWSILSHTSATMLILFFQKTLKRRRNAHLISPAAQLNSPDPVRVDLPPKPDAPAGGKVKESDPMMNYPDPKSFMPPAPQK